MKSRTVTFETKCYEKDWRLLFSGHIEKLIEDCDYPFDKKILHINNVDDVTLVKKEADKLIDKGIIDSYIVVEPYAEEVLRFFQIDKDSFNGGYYYSITELTAIYLCDTDYLVHFSGDSSLVHKNGYNWIKDSLDLFEKDEKVICTNPTWMYEDLNFSKDMWRYELGFSDQVYCIITDIFKKPIYNEKNSASERYPKHGGDSFEKRIDSYLRNKDLYRGNHRHVFYKSPLYYV